MIEFDYLEDAFDFLSDLFEDGHGGTASSSSSTGHHVNIIKLEPQTSSSQVQFNSHSAHRVRRFPNSELESDSNLRFGSITSESLHSQPVESGVAKAPSSSLLGAGEEIDKYSKERIDTYRGDDAIG